MSDQRPGPPPHAPASGDLALEPTGATPLRPSDPARLGPYVPLGLLGSGGMGRVYLARPADDAPGLAAVKVIRPEYAEDTEFRRRFQREAGVHDRIRTPYAPRLLGTGFEPEDEHGRELLWMATEYLPGLNLTDAVRDCGTLPPAAVWRLVGELGRALSALAAAGVVHRDLKPSNVLLSADGVHVIDFGISQAVDSSAITITGSRVGTPAYMSPEYLRDGRCDAASDVFSLAGTLVYAATGHAPFGDGTGVDVMHRVAFEEPKPALMSELASADPALAALLTACLAKNPADRPTPAHLTEAAADTGRPWPDPLNSRLLARRRSCASLAHATARETAHFRVPTRRDKPSTPPPAEGAADAPGAVEAPAPRLPGGHSGTPGGQYGGMTPAGTYGGPTPAGTYGPPTPPATAYGTPTPAGAYGASTPPVAYGVPASAGTYGPPTSASAYGAPPSGEGGGGEYGPHAPAPGQYGAPPTWGGGQGPTVTSVAPRRRKGAYFAVVAALAMCAVAVGAYFVTRAPVEDASSAAPTAGTTTAPDGKAAAPLPGSSDSPSPSAEKDKEKKDGASPTPGPSRETPDATPGDTAGPTPGAEGSSGGDGDAAAPTPAPAATKTATKPATPAWISQCTYYSGTELTDRGDEGQRVVQVQCMLQKRGYSVGGSGVDGKFGKDTESAVEQFQAAKRLEVDGQVGPDTWAALRGTT
ncbi:Serine/threonine protein kinase [Streptomyces sp. cf124]|uniref:serine/threonine-protein kinase n=1 Tax=Streptomyces sp. cf124 TaxID=1761903 RepID=UPI0008E0D785|nr:serine/threonine-protein kinase [Streptomyces sp. cf124]SFN24302.1 Serine/threonine protein kinase [Streptomyces sp. cf124]